MTEERFDAPTYSLAQVQARVRSGDIRITKSAQRWAYNHGYDTRDIERCILELTLDDFYKTMASERHPDRWQDVYQPVYLGDRMYVKVQIGELDRAILISFKW